MEYREEILEKEVESGKNQIEERKKRGEWRNLKIKKSTYNQIKKLSHILDIKKYKVIDLSVMVLSLLLSEKIVMEQGEEDEVLLECKIRYGYDEERNYGWIELDPICVLKKVVLPFYKKKRILENLIQNIESLSQS